MIFDGIEKDYIVPLTGRRRSAWAPISRNLITVTGMPGAHLSHTDVQVRVITVPVLVKAENIIDLQKAKEDMAEWLVHDEPKELIFKDEPDRVYYALVDGELELDEIFSTGQGEITFICPDPFKYGPEKVIETTSDTFIVENNGTAEAKPIIELTATQKATFAMISNGEEYNLIGRPANVEEQLVDEKVRVLYERGDTINEWTSIGTSVDEGAVSGSFVSDGSRISVESYGTGTNWHGPALLKDLGVAIQNFEVEMKCEFLSDTNAETVRIEMYLFDEYMNKIGKMAIVDDSKSIHEIWGHGRLGDENSGKNLLSKGEYRYHALDYFHGVLRVKRENNEFTFYISRMRNDGTHYESRTIKYYDVNAQFAGRLRYVQIHIGTYGNTGYPGQTSAQYFARIHNIKVNELLQILDDQTPYIVYPGDVITFDHSTADILLNGESRKDLKAFGGSFFTLKKGVNTLTIMPENTFITKVTYRERYK